MFTPRLSLRDQLWTPGTPARLGGASEPREALAIPIPSPLPVFWRFRSVSCVMEIDFRAGVTLDLPACTALCGGNFALAVVF